MRLFSKILLILALYGCTKENGIESPKLQTVVANFYSDSVTFEADIISKGSFVIKHRGFVISTVNPAKIGSGTNIMLGDAVTTDHFTTSTLDTFVDGSQYSITAYVITEKDTIYSEPLTIDGSGKYNRISGKWSKLSDVKFEGRFGAVTFEIDGKVYLYGGYSGNNLTHQTLKDLYVYSPQDDSWIQRASMPADASGRAHGVAFTANGKGYVGLGIGEDGLTYLKDFWSYDPENNQWTRVADFIGHAREGAMAFGINNKGYVGCGSDDSQSYRDFFVYNASSNVWDYAPSIPTDARTYPFSFVIDNKGYVGGGRNNGVIYNTFYEFDPTQGVEGSWITKRDLSSDDRDSDTGDVLYASLTRDAAATFVIAGRGYIVGGVENNETWQYDPSGDRWYKLSPFGGVSRYGAIGFSIGNFGYVTNGFSGVLAFFDDTWKFDPRVADK